MFEKFTQKAIDVVQSAQNYALQFCHTRVLSQHILLGLVFQTKGVQAKILNFDKINFGELTIEVHNSAEINPNKKEDGVFFSKDARLILRYAVELSDKFKSQSVMPQHIALAIMQNKELGAYKILKKFNIDEEKIIPNLVRMLDKSSSIKQIHPEAEIKNLELVNVNDFFKEKTISKILSNAKSKATTSDFEIIGTEQILQSILDNDEYSIVKILEKYSIDKDSFSKKLGDFKTRQAEFENSEKQMIFTPNAFRALLFAIDYAKETGSVSINPEHIVLGILKSKRGIAYKILSDSITSTTDFEESVIKKMDDNIPETLAILRLAKEEARSLNSSTVGTEMILLGILSYGTGVAYDVLRKLGISFKDARAEVEKFIKPQQTDETLNYSLRAKKLLEIAYSAAQEHKKTKVKSENLLYGITKMSDCIAMKVLDNLGTDILEIRQGIKQRLLGGMEL